MRVNPGQEIKTGNRGVPFSNGQSVTHTARELNRFIPAFNVMFVFSGAIYRNDHGQGQGVTVPMSSDPRTKQTYCNLPLPLPVIWELHVLGPLNKSCYIDVTAPIKEENEEATDTHWSICQQRGLKTTPIGASSSIPHTSRIKEDDCSIVGPGAMVTDTGGPHLLSHPLPPPAPRAWPCMCPV